MSDRNTYCVIVALREGEADVSSLGEKLFEGMRQSWIAEGFTNLQSEWFEASSEGHLPDHMRVFVYWEDPDQTPTMAQMREWGLQARRLPVES